MRAQIAVVLAVAVVGSGGRAAGEGRGAAAPPTVFASSRPGEVVVPVTIGSAGPFRFLLDTGSTHTAVTGSLAVLLDAAPVARTTMTAAAGTVECVVVALPPVAIGGARAEGLTATVLPATAAAALGPGLDGVVGQDFLARFRYTIDYRRSRILWHDSAYAPAGLRLGLVPSGDRWLVELPQEGHASAYRFVPDSGADTLVLYGDALADRVVSDWQAPPVTLGSLTGACSLRSGLVDSLRVGGVPLARQLAVVVPARAGGDADGLLPLSGFASVFFNVQDGYLVIQPR